MHTSSPPSRKRSRLQPVDQPVSISPASKRRKLSGLADDAPTALSSFTRTIEGVLGLGKEDAVDGEREIAESVLGDEGEGERDLGGDADGVQHEENAVADAVPSPTPKRGRGRPKKSDFRHVVENRVPESAVGDANDIDELADGVGITTEEAVPSPTPKRGRGRPKKSGSTPHANASKAPVEKVTEVLVGGHAETTPAPVKRGRGRPRKDSMPKPVAEMDDKAEENSVDQLGENVGLRMSARRKSARFDGDETPKGILTPSKRKDGIRKSVAFEIGDPGLGLRVGEDELGFKDLPMRQTKETSNGDDGNGTMDELNDDAFLVEKKSRKVHEVDEEEITCIMCSGADSEEPNEILLCDSCDTAYHQECYDIPIIPEDDWLCRDCQPEEEDILDLVEEVPIEIDEVEATIVVQNHMPEIEEFETHLHIMQRLLLQKLTGGRRLKLHGLDEEFRKVHQLVEQTVLAGEGNSMLVIGARGSGKTTLVETVLSEISSEHRDDFHVVRLNGFVHTDDKLALRETWRQLGREMAVEDELTGKTTNYADTLASLLALLSHPSELDQSNSDHTAKSVIFILDEFDLFTAHPRQTLLYNLFDIAQARKAPIAVLGITTRIDVVESLEKRVKSRFSHRYVHLSLTRNLPSFWDVCKEGLLIDEDGTDDDFMDHGASAGWYEFLAYWTSMVENLYADDPLFMDHLQSLFYRTKSVPDFFTSALIPISSLTPTSLPLTGAHFTSVLNPPDSKLTLLPSLSDLELALLISAARLDIILDTDTCNFSMAYDEYCTLTSRHKIQSSSTGIVALGGNAKVWGRDVAVGAWEKLVETELLVPAAMGPTREGGREGKMWRVDVALEEIAGSVSSLTGAMAKWCREI